MLPDRPLPVDDVATIHDLVARYCVAVDRHDMDALMALVSDDVELHWHDGRVVRGRAAVRTHCAEQWSTLGPTLHAVSSLPLVDQRPDGTASSFHYGHAEHLDPTRRTVTRSAIAYTNDYRGEQGRWVMTRRRAELLYTCSLGELVDHRGRPGSWHVTSAAAP